MAEARKQRVGTKSERTKERILQAALELFSEQGFTATSVRDIAARADMTHAGLLHHFANKDDLLVQILAYREKQDEESARRFAGFGIDRLFAWTMEIIDTNVQHEDRIALYVRLSAEATDPQHPASAYFTRRYERLIAALETAFTEHFAVSPPAHAISALEAAQGLVGLLDGLQVQWLILPGSIDMPRIARAYLRSLGVIVP